ncbi:MAG: 50S ribosomal protein L17 [Candidatus Omnitrophica bacterium]|nr:50S ribosomal protein L17 [Candidatus Omnitrophota bacterium]
MRHADKRFKLNRFTSWHKATLKSLARNMVIHQGIRTTISRAKAVRPITERLVSLAKKNTLSAKREAFKILGSHKLVSFLFNEVGPLFAKRDSGFTRIINLKQRRGDNAQLVIFELTERKIKERKKAKKAKESAPEERIEKSPEEKTPQLQEKKDIPRKPAKKFFGGIRKIFKKERDSL